MLFTALTPPLFPQGEARAAAEAKAQPADKKAADKVRRALPAARLTLSSCC